MIKFFKKHPYSTMGYVALAFISAFIGFREGVFNGFILFGVTATIFTYMDGT